MKNICQLLLFTFCFLSNINCQDSTIINHKNEIKLALFPFSKTSINLGYERYFKQISSMLTVEYRPGLKKDHYKTGYFIQLEQRFYLNSDKYQFKRPNYFSPAISYRHLKKNDYYRYTGIDSYRIGIYWGNKYAGDKKIIWDFNVGLHYVFTTVTGNYFPLDEMKKYWQPGYEGLKLTANLSLGYRF